MPPSIQEKHGFYVIQYLENGVRKTISTRLIANEKNRLIVLKKSKEIESRLYIDKISGKLKPKELKTAITLSFAVKKFDKEHLSLKSHSHRRNYNFAMEHLINVIGRKKLVTEITTEDISKYIAYLKDRVRNATLHTYIRYAKMLFNFLADENIITKTPFRKRQTPRREEIEIEIFSQEDLDLLLNYTYEKDIKLFRCFSMLLGTRPIDLLNLKYEDIKLEQRKINIRMAKTGNLIVFPIYDELGMFLIDNFNSELNKDSKEKLFNGYTVSQLGKRFRRFLLYLKIPKSRRYTLKTFRKTFGTKMAALNIATKDLMYLLGHKEVETTMKYYIKAKSEEIGKKINFESKKFYKIEKKCRRSADGVQTD